MVPDPELFFWVAASTACTGAVNSDGMGRRLDNSFNVFLLMVNHLWSLIQEAYQEIHWSALF